WSETNKLRTWRDLWCALAEVEAGFGLVSEEQLTDLRSHRDEIDIERTMAFEKDLRHDVMAEIHTYSEQAPIGAGIIHLGATSTDIKDNAIALQCKRSLGLLIGQLDAVLLRLAELIEAHASVPIIGFTHLQPAEPTTLGFRLSVYAQDLLSDREQLARTRVGLKGKGIRGAVGTAASFVEILGREHFEAFDRQLSEKLDLPFFDVTTQTYPRKQDYELLCVLAGLGASLNKFAFDLRLMQSPVIFEWSEPFGEKQIGSSAMPFKKNPINAEKMNSLARLLAQYPAVAWSNAANSLLERTLDDSANRRTILPEAFLIADELLSTALKLVQGLVFHFEQMERNFAKFAPFACIETILMACCQMGANRQEMHAHLRRLSLKAWDAVIESGENPLLAMIEQDAVVGAYLSPERLRGLESVEQYYGLAAEKALQTSERIRSCLQQN
ncbi:MAG: adenylosuccinate lyase, partial [Anaerolineaceae bacterium]|nr:adenylosuccinate lyase [Anaerolineaceae bacterium]